MKEIGILYSTPMILAKLAGRKTVTRRTRGLNIINQEPDKWEAVRFWNGVAKFCEKHNWTNELYIKSPFGQSGDIMYARENFRVARWNHEDGEVSFRYEADGTEGNYIGFEEEKIFNKYWQQSCDDLYKAGHEPNDEGLFVDYKPEDLRLRPNIFLPKAASRIYERVISVRPERLGDITEEDAVREGIEQECHEWGEIFYPDGTIDRSCVGVKVWQRKDYMKTKVSGSPHYSSFSAVDSFKTLWQSINGPESWNPDTWVWRIETEVLSTTGRPEKM